jgi:hypothetical protein
VVVSALFVHVVARTSHQNTGVGNGGLECSLFRFLASLNFVADTFQNRQKMASMGLNRSGRRYAGSLIP